MMLLQWKKKSKKKKNLTEAAVFGSVFGYDFGSDVGFLFWLWFVPEKGQSDMSRKDHPLFLVDRNVCDCDQGFFPLSSVSCSFEISEVASPDVVMIGRSGPEPW